MLCTLLSNFVEVAYYGATWCTFKLKIQSKINTVFSKKNFFYISGAFLYFGKRNFLKPRLKKFRRELSELEKKTALRKFLIFRESLHKNFQAFNKLIKAITIFLLTSLETI